MEEDLTRSFNYFRTSEVIRNFSFERAPDPGELAKAKKSGGPVLEIGCGTGRVLIPTARAGIEITGLDLSNHMLERCRANLSSESEEVRSRVTLVKADMRSFRLGREFRLATIPFRPFQHLTTVEDQLSCLASVREHGGRSILDLFNPKLEARIADDVGVEIDEGLEFSTPDGATVQRKHRVARRDLFNQIVYSDLIYYVAHPDGREERLVHAFPMRYLFQVRGRASAREGRLSCRSRLRRLRPTRVRFKIPGRTDNHHRQGAVAGIRPETRSLVRCLSLHTDRRITAGVRHGAADPESAGRRVFSRTPAIL